MRIVKYNNNKYLHPVFLLWLENIPQNRAFVYTQKAQVKFF